MPNVQISVVQAAKEETDWDIVIEVKGKYKIGKSIVAKNIAHALESQGFTVSLVDVEQLER